MVANKNVLENQHLQFNLNDKIVFKYSNPRLSTDDEYYDQLHTLMNSFLSRGLIPTM